MAELNNRSSGIGRDQTLEKQFSLPHRSESHSLNKGVSENAGLSMHFLCEINCDLAQGYFIGRRVAADQMPQWLERWQARLVWS